MAGLIYQRFYLPALTMLTANIAQHKPIRIANDLTLVDESILKLIMNYIDKINVYDEFVSLTRRYFSLESTIKKNKQEYIHFPAQKVVVSRLEFY